MALPVEYEHASNVIIFLNGLLLVVLIALSNWEKFRRFNSYSIAGDEGLRGEQTGLVDKGEAEAQEKNWTEVLHRNIENFVPFFLTTIFIRNISFLVLSSTSNQFNLTIYAFLAFQYVYLASRLAHMIGYFSPTLKFLRWTGFGVTAVINALLAMMAILITFIGDWKGHETNGDILGITCKGASIALFVLVIKIHSVLFATYKVKYYDENLLFAARLQNIARNDVEAFVPLCGFLLIFIGAIDMVILSSVPLLPTYNFNPFLITSLTLILAFTVFRLAHSIAYYRGLQPYRSLSYVLGLLALQVFGLVSYAIYTDYFVALSNSPLVADFSFGFKLLLGMFSLILLDVWRTAVVAALTGYNRMMVEKRAINIEDRPYLPQSDDAVDVDGRDIGLDGANMLTSEKLQSIHLNDLAFGVLFFYVLAQLISANLNEAESIGALVIAALFAASRYVPFLASFGLRRHTSGSVASSLLSLVFVIVLLLWSFIEYEVFISKRQ